MLNWIRSSRIFLISCSARSCHSCLRRIDSRNAAMISSRVLFLYAFDTIFYSSNCVFCCKDKKYINTLQIFETFFVVSGGWAKKLKGVHKFEGLGLVWGKKVIVFLGFLPFFINFVIEMETKKFYVHGTDSFWEGWKETFLWWREIISTGHSAYLHGWRR